MSALNFDTPRWRGRLEELRKREGADTMGNNDMHARGPDGGGGGLSAAQYAEREHLDRVELGRAAQFTITLTITPAYAAMVLAKYAPEGSNRKLRTGEVRRITNNIRFGRWEGRTHQGVAFDEDGNLSDGQHRFHACVAADMPIRLPVTFGQPREVFPAVDQNAPRGTADLVYVARVNIADAPGASAVARNVLILQRYDIEPRKQKVDKLAQLEFARRNASELNEVVRIGAKVADGIKGGISRAQLATAAFLIRAACRDHRAVDDFFDVLQSGANLAARSPVLLLRDGLKSGAVLTDNPVGDVRIGQLVGAVINGWTLWRGRRPTTSLRTIVWKPDQQFPQARP